MLRLLIQATLEKSNRPNLLSVPRSLVTRAGRSHYPARHSMCHAFWFMVYGWWFLVSGLWFLAYGLWSRETKNTRDHKPETITSLICYR